MGHTVLTDLELITWICSQVVAWGEKLGSDEESIRPEPITGGGPSFIAEACLIADYEKSDDRNFLQIRVRLKRRGSGRHRDRFIYILYGNTSRRLQHAKTWRTAFGGLSKIREKRPHRRLTVLNLSRDIYWVPECSCDDLKAQIVVALSQLRMIGNNPIEWIINVYLQKFRIYIPKGFDRQKFRQDCCCTVAADLIRFWIFPEDFRAFRKYIAVRIKRFTSSERPELIVNANPEEMFSFKSSRGDEFDERLGQVPSSLNEAVPNITSRGAEKMTVAEVAFELGYSARYIYRLIRSGILTAYHDQGRIFLPMDQFEKLRQTRDRRRRHREKVMLLERQGKSYAAARKTVYRSSKRTNSESPVQC
jgi:excisionase family DNA binding protein